MKWRRFYHPFTESLAVDKYGSYKMQLFTDVPFSLFMNIARDDMEAIRARMKKISKKQRHQIEIEQMTYICKKVEEYCYNWDDEEEKIEVFFEARILNIDVRVYYFDSPNVDEDGYETGDVVDTKTGETIGNTWRFLNRQKELRIEDDLEGML